jgi:hypothetical protein
MHVASEFFIPTKLLRKEIVVVHFSARFTERSLRKWVSLMISSALKPPLHTTASRCGTPMLTRNACHGSARVDTARRRATASKCFSLIMEASEYKGCTTSSAMKSERGPPASALVSDFLSTSGFSLIFEDLLRFYRK